jgi:predicted transporter
MACWRNIGAFSVQGLAWGGVILAFGVVANIFSALLQESQIIALATVPIGLLISTVFYASLYFTFADCFAPDAVSEVQPG